MNSDCYLNSHPRWPHLQRLSPRGRSWKRGCVETVCVPLSVSDELKVCSQPTAPVRHINAESGPRSKGSSRSSMSRDDIGFKQTLYPGDFPPSTPDYGSSLTPAERAREKRLRDDPMADVIGPLFVDCRRCKARITLSPKSVYDPFHWKSHKERCLKKPIGALVTKKSNSQRTVRHPFILD